MKTSKSQNRFTLIAAVVLLISALLIIISIPSINSYRRSIASRLVASSKNQKDIKKQLNLLEQAHLMDSQNTEATDNLVNFWLDRGEVNRAINVYKSSKNPDYDKIGNLALEAQDYSKALSYFKKSTAGRETSTSLVGESEAQFNLGHNSEGCSKAVSASKLGLSNQAAKSALQVCIILDPTQSEAASLVPKLTMSGDREQGYFLLANKIFKVGESKLSSVSDKSANDWLTLCKLSAARGAIDESIVRCTEGYKLNSSNTLLNSELQKLYDLKSVPSQSNEFANKLKQLQFLDYR